MGKRCTEFFNRIFGCWKLISSVNVCGFLGSRFFQTSQGVGLVVGLFLGLINLFKRRLGVLQSFQCCMILGGVGGGFGDCQISLGDGKLVGYIFGQMGLFCILFLFQGSVRIEFVFYFQWWMLLYLLLVLFFIYFFWGFFKVQFFWGFIWIIFRV